MNKFSANLVQNGLSSWWIEIRRNYPYDFFFKILKFHQNYIFYYKNLNLKWLVKIENYIPKVSWRWTNFYSIFYMHTLRNLSTNCFSHEKWLTLSIMVLHKYLKENKICNLRGNNFKLKSKLKFWNPEKFFFFPWKVAKTQNGSFCPQWRCRG